MKSGLHSLTDWEKNSQSPETSCSSRFTVRETEVQKKVKELEEISYFFLQLTSKYTY